jgi:hypothetical protein
LPISHQPKRRLTHGNDAASTIRSHVAVKTEKPAGLARRLINRRYKMHEHLSLLLLIVVILIIKVKIIIKTR